MLGLSFLAFIMSSYITEYVACVPVIGYFLFNHFPSLFHFSVCSTSVFHFSVPGSDGEGGLCYCVHVHLISIVLLDRSTCTKIKTLSLYFQGKACIHVHVVL